MKESIKDRLPKSYEGTILKVGVVVKDWAQWLNFCQDNQVVGPVNYGRGHAEKGNIQYRRLCKPDSAHGFEFHDLIILDELSPYIECFKTRVRLKVQTANV